MNNNTPVSRSTINGSLMARCIYLAALIQSLLGRADQTWLLAACSLPNAYTCFRRPPALAWVQTATAASFTL
jgi:hypothetical protein